MDEIKYQLTENIIEDTNVMYGLCSILQDNGVPFNLKRNKSHYLIQYDNELIDDDGLIFVDLEDTEVKWINDSYKTSKIKVINGVNEFLNSNINNLLKDFKNKNFEKTEDLVTIGNHYCGKSKQQRIKGSSLIKQLSILGHIKTTMIIYNKSDNTECDMMLIPSLNCNIKNLINLRYKKLDTGEEKKCYNTREIGIKSKADIFLKITELIREYDNYESIYIMNNTISANASIKNNVEKISIHQYSLELYEYLKRLVNIRDTDKIVVKNKMKGDLIELRINISMFILNNSYTNFNKVIKTISKPVYTDLFNSYYGIKKDFIKELVNVYDNRTQEIFLNESVMKTGKQLGYLIYKEKKGFEILAKLYGISNVNQMAKTLAFICDTYKRYTKYCILDENEVEDIIGLLKTNKDAKTVASAIVLNARVKYENKNNK